MLGARIALLRRRAGMSQRNLAQALGVSPSAVGMYEQDRRTPPAELLIAMAGLFSVSTDFLLTGRSAPADSGVLRELLERFREGTTLTEPDAALFLSVLLTEELTQREKSAMMLSGGGGPVDETFMREALKLAEEAAAEGEVPVGCVITDGDTIVGRGRNRRESLKNALCHAEIEAINEACKTLGGWRLWRCTLYVTLEPCPMCAGAIINARIPRVVYGARDSRAGSCGSLINLFAVPYNHQPVVTEGVLAEESAAILKKFFKDLREHPTEKYWKKA